MPKIYVYADETGDLGYHREAACFGIGTATCQGDHGRQMWLRSVFMPWGRA